MQISYAKGLGGALALGLGATFILKLFSILNDSQTTKMRIGTNTKDN
jgi:hypothetical protein